MKTKLSISEFSVLSGIDRRTISKRLAELEPEISGTAHLYLARVALPLLYQPPESDVVDLTRERALLAAEQRRKLELQNNAEEGTLCRAVDVEQKLAALFKSLAQAVEVFPDQAEREHGASPEIVTMLQDLGDRLRESLYAAAINASPPEAAE